MEQLNEAQLAKGEAYIQNMKREYGKAMASIQKDINVFYQRFAKNNDVDLATARQMLKAGELKEFKWSVEDYIKAGRENAIDQRWMKELENASIRVRMSRLESLQLQMRQQVELLTAKRQTGASSLLGDIYKDSYYQNIFELQKGVGIGASFAKLNTQQIESVLATPWAPDGSNFSQRIWGDRSKLIHELQTTLTQGLIRGDSSDLMINRLSERMGVSRSRAETLILTESAYFSGASRRASYVELNVEKYRNVATLDKRTSDICRTMDGSIFLVSEAKAGLNCAPFHARCRTVDIPYYEDNVKERAARDDDGKTYNVPGDMTYPEWEKKHVTGEMKEPAGEGFNRRYNPKASYYVDLPATPETVLDEIADVNRSIARQGFKEGKEIMVIMDKVGTEIGRATGEINKIVFSPEIHEMLLNSPVNSVTLTHNHPRGTRINVKDIRNFSLYPSLLNIIAVGHDGGVSFVSTQGILVSAMVFQDVMMQQGAKVTAGLQTNKEYAMMSSSAQREYFDFLLMQAIITELGWVYGEEFGDAKTDRRF
ncbi:minor capsid protein [Paenibacillus anseongense]|uniref:minor capsid protein n=1 Tax=Paenibacillus anseongense TaxID=2682845 RepID=UPI002DBB0283|nr:minor capsid protein [Paenibacillus anseongense]MEC0269400.1 minor capsid protein [Paenibacillus anseongense]